MRVSFILPAQEAASSRGYQISTSTNFEYGIRVAPGASTRLVGQVPGRVNYWISSIATPAIVVGPAVGLVRGEEMYQY